MKRVMIFLSVICLAISLTACNNDISPNDYDSANAGVVSKVEPGVILVKREVTVTSKSAVGDVAGGAIGGIAGSAIGGGRGALLGIVAGAVAGGIIGHHVADAVNRQKALEYIVKLHDGSTVSIVQGLETQLYVGQKVLLIYGARSRLIPDPSGVSTEIEQNHAAPKMQPAPDTTQAQATQQPVRTAQLTNLPAHAALDTVRV